MVNSRNRAVSVYEGGVKFVMMRTSLPIALIGLATMYSVAAHTQPSPSKPTSGVPSSAPAARPRVGQHMSPRAADVKDVTPAQPAQSAGRPSMPSPEAAKPYLLPENK